MPNAPQGSGLINPITGQDPNYILQVLQAQRQAKIADALAQQGMNPIDYDQRGRVSPTQGLAKLFDAYIGQKLGRQSDQTMAGMQAGNMQRMGAAYGTGPPDQSQPQMPQQPPPMSNASAVLAQGAQQGSVGPTNQNAATMNSMQPQGQPQGQPQQPQGAPLNPFGAPPMLAYMASQGDPGAQEQLKSWLANHQTTNEQKNSQDPTIGASVRGNLMTQNMTELQKLQLARASVQPGSPQAAQLDDAISKANFVAPIDAKPGTPVLDARSLQPRFFAPKTAEGIGLNFANPLQPSAYPLPGYAGANAGIQGAEQGAKQANTITTATGPSGQPMTGYGSSLVGPPPSFQTDGTGAGAAAMRAKIAASGDTGVLAAFDRQFPTGAGRGIVNPPGVVAGPSTTDTAIQKGAADVIAQAPRIVQQSRSANTGLDFALQALQKVQATGPGTIKTADVLAALNNAGIPIASDGVNNYQALSKYLSNSLNTASEGTGASGSDARFESFSHGQPNQQTMNKTALDGAIRYVQSQHDAAIARGNFLPQAYQKAAAAGDPNAALTAQSQWSNLSNPKFFSLQRMAPDEQMRELHGMSDAQVRQFKAWRGQMAPLGGQ